MLFKPTDYSQVGTHMIRY